MNSSWTITGFETQIFQQYKLIYMLDKLLNSLGYKSIVIGYDNRLKSERIAESIASGLSKRTKVMLTNKPVSSPMLTTLLKSELYDCSLYITGNYDDWRTYGFKIRIDKGRNLSFKEFKNAKKIMNEFSPKNYIIEYADEAQRGNFEDYYLQEIKAYFPKKLKLDFHLTLNVLNYTRADVTLKLFRDMGCHVDFFNASSIHNKSPHPLDEENIEESKYFLDMTNSDMVVSFMDGEMLVIQTKNKVFEIQEIGLMLAEINKNQYKKIICSENFFRLQKFAEVNKIKVQTNDKPLMICNTPNTLTVTSNNCIIDSNYAKSMDSHYVLLKILEYLQEKNLTIDEFSNYLLNKYEI